jgi:hypothetical protein
VIGQEFGAVLEAKSIKICFADFKCSGVTYKNTPDIVALSENLGVIGIKLVGELKVRWIPEHSLSDATINDQAQLAIKLAQPLRDMQKLGCEYGFISTYEETVFLRQYQSPGGA